MESECFGASYYGALWSSSELRYFLHVTYSTLTRKILLPYLIRGLGAHCWFLQCTVRWVHFLYLKLLVCIPFSTGDRMSVLKIWCLHILGFRYRKCTLTIPTSSRTGTVTLLGAWCDCLANKFWGAQFFVTQPKSAVKNTHFAWAGGTSGQEFPVSLKHSFTSFS
jgi:hypothetical protein